MTIERLENRRVLAATLAEPISIPSVAQNFLETSLAFEQNLGQTDAQYDFVSHGPSYSIRLDQTEAELLLASGENEASLSMSVVGGNQNAEARPVSGKIGTTSYRLGAPAHWIEEVPLYSRVEFADVYDGIDVVYYGTDQRRLEYDFVVAPGVDYGAIRLEFSGADSMRLDDRGDLVFDFPDGQVVQPAPYTYQSTAEGRVVIESNYVLHSDGAVGFHVGEYDDSESLIIDPRVIYLSYLEGLETGSAEAIALGQNGEIYVGGNTDNPLPHLINSELGELPLGTVAFVRRYEFGDQPRVTGVVFGGDANDVLHDLAVHPVTGDVYAVGSTESDATLKTGDNIASSLW